MGRQRKETSILSLGAKLINVKKITAKEMPLKRGNRREERLSEDFDKDVEK